MAVRSSSPVDSSPSKTPFTTSSSKRYVSKVYSRRLTSGPSSGKRIRRSPTPDGSSDTSSLGHAGDGMAKVGDGIVILGELESDQGEGSEENTRETEVGETRRGGACQPVRAPGRKQLADEAGNGSSKGLRRTQPRRTASYCKSGNSSSAPASKREKVPYPKAESSRTNEISRKPAKLARTDTETDISSATVLHPSAPPINILPATSPLASSQSQPVSIDQAPSTPPRKRTKRHGPLTPQSSPRDLSALFAPVSPAKSPGLLRRNTGDGNEGGQVKKTGPGGLFRRMLDKTQSLGAVPSPVRSVQGDEDYFNFAGDTEGSVSYQSPNAGPSTGVGRTHSLPSTPSRSPLKEEVPSAVQSLIVPIASSSRLESSLPTSGGRGKRTYGRSRTILAEVEDSPKSGTSTPGKDKEAIKESYAELRKQFEVDNTGGDEAGSGNLMMDLLAVRGGQSVSDLRSKGENRRFMDELGYLVDPIMDPGTSTGLKRSSICDILRSMQDEEWLQRAKICGQVERIWEAIFEARGKKGDEIIDAMCLLYLTNLVKSGSGLDLILRSHNETCEAILLNALKIKDGPLDENSRVKSTGLVAKIRTMYQQLDLGWNSNTISTRRLSSYLVLEITSSAIRAPSQSAALLTSEKALSRINKSLSVDVMGLAARFDLAEKGLPLIPTDRQADIDIDHISQCLTLISRLIGHSLQDRQTLAEMHETMADVIVNSLVAGVFLVSDGAKASSSVGHNTTIQSLQILATISNVSSEWAQAVASADGGLTTLARILIHRQALVTLSKTVTVNDKMVVDEDDGIQFFSSSQPKSSPPPEAEIGGEDVLCLVLVILTAAILGSSETTTKLASLRIGIDCINSKPCLRVCKCLNAGLFAEHLVQIYLEHKNSDAASANLIAAYIALILSKIILTQPQLLDLLPGDDRSSKTEGLIDVLGELKGLQSFLHTRLRVVAGAEGLAGGEDMEGDDGVVQRAIDDLVSLNRMDFSQ